MFILHGTATYAGVQYILVVARVISTVAWSLRVNSTVALSLCCPHLSIVIHEMLYVSLQFSSTAIVVSPLHTSWWLAYTVVADSTVQLVQLVSDGGSHETLTSRDCWLSSQVNCTGKTMIGAAGGPKQFRMKIASSWTVNNKKKTQWAKNISTGNNADPPWMIDDISSTSD